MKNILKCSCGQTSQDIRTDPNAWDNWNLGPKDTCPDCVTRGVTATLEAEAKARAEAQARLKKSKVL